MQVKKYMKKYVGKASLISKSLENATLCKFLRSIYRLDENHEAEGSFVRGAKYS